MIDSGKQTVFVKLFHGVFNNMNISYKPMHKPKQWYKADSFNPVWLY